MQPMGSARLTLGETGQVFEWVEGWADVPYPKDAMIGWAHHGLAINGRGEIVSFHPGRPDVLMFSVDGQLVRSWPTPLREGHGITVVNELGDDFVWLADPGKKRRKERDYAYEADNAIAPNVVKFDLLGAEIMRLEVPPHVAYESGLYSPTAVVVAEERYGGNGDIWVADGYGQYLVHCYGADGKYIKTLSGEEGAGRFNCPHGLFIDTRPSSPQLWVADRGNARVQIYNLEGSFIGVLGQDVLNSPSAIVASRDRTVIAELNARLAVFGAANEFLGYLGDNGSVCAEPGWPNQLDARGVPSRTQRLQPGCFNSPHGLAADGEGNVYVAEWLIGGRMVKLGQLRPGGK